jgi:hypothetical protein
MFPNSRFRASCVGYYYYVLLVYCILCLYMEHHHHHHHPVNSPFVDAMAFEKQSKFLFSRRSAGVHIAAAGAVTCVATSTTNIANIQSSSSNCGSSSSSVAWALEEDPMNQETEEEKAKQQEQLRQRMMERRQLMEASRSSNSRQSYLDLSKQRASLVYNTTYRGVTCPPNIPCL